MAQKYYNVKEAAEVLRVSVHEIKQMLERRELHAYRDGADWKFRVEEIDALAQQAPAPDEGEGDVLLSEVELGQSDAGASGTVIGMANGGKASAGSDIKVDSDIHLADQPESAPTAQQEEVDSKVSQFEELDLTLEEDLTLEDSQFGPTPGSPGGDSTIDLSGKDLDDDDLVLGGSGAGSDITIGGDSGISLVDPADSGLSLEEPLDLAGSRSQSLELGEDDMLALSEDTDLEAPTELKTDDDFLLTPLEEVGEEEDSESGSQVIALDTEGEGDEAATMVAGGAASSMAAMLEEDLGTEPVLDMGIGEPMAKLSPGGLQPGAFGEEGPLTPSEAVLPETPYSIGVVLGQAACVIFLIFCGMMMFDLMRNMWSWDAPYSFNSPLMDTILGWFE